MMTSLHESGGPGVLGPVARDTLAGRVVLILKRFILIEELQEGDQLPPERTLAETLHVSLRVVREALGILVGEGIVVKQHGRGAFVRDCDRERLAGDLVAPAGGPRQMDGVHAARCALEIGAMHLAAQSATPADLDALRGIVASMQRRVGRGEAIAADDLLFHQTLLRATHNPALQQIEYLIIESIRLDVYDQPGLLRRSLRDETNVIAAHRAVVQALAERDGDAASRAMRAHLDKLLK